MAVKIRLQRKGKIKRPFYRVVVIDQRAKRDGEPIEVLGQFDPLVGEDGLNVNIERVNYWLQTGAKASDTVVSLLRKSSSQSAEPHTTQGGEK
jgi:small subunit ribosomal protein S16